MIKMKSTLLKYIAKLLLPYIDINDLPKDSEIRVEITEFGFKLDVDSLIKSKEVTKQMKAIKELYLDKQGE